MVTTADQQIAFGKIKIKMAGDVLGSGEKKKVGFRLTFF